MTMLSQVYNICFHTQMNGLIGKIASVDNLFLMYELKSQAVNRKIKDAQFKMI